MPEIAAADAWERGADAKKDTSRKPRNKRPKESDT